MLFSPSRFDAMIASSHRADFGYRRASLCPCVNPTSLQASPKCPLCGAKGVMWAPEVTAGCYAGIQNQTQSKVIATFGTWEPGDATVTIPNGSTLYTVGRYDRLRSLEATAPFSSVMTSIQNNRILGTGIVVSRVFWLSPDGASIVEGGIPTIAANGALTWPAGQAAPPAGVSYTVEGVKAVEYFVYTDMAQVRTVGVAGLPKKLQARRLDLFNRVGPS